MSRILFDLEHEDTIAAISTPFGSGAISIIRLSGKAAFAITQKVLRSKEKIQNIENRKAAHGFIIEDNVRLDEVLLIKYESPDSYTGEDVVEINAHGGIYITTKILELLLKNGARAALPGEFTKRAFFNGKIDLMQAESIQEIISARSAKALSIALRTLEGDLSKECERLKNVLIDILADISVMIDYPDYDYEGIEETELIISLSGVLSDLEKLLSSYKKGSMYRNGVKIAIVGKPNVGKSTFLNSFIGKNRAIVTDIPGTTRDTIEEMLEIGGVPITLIDTAGLHATENIIEKIGQEKTLQTIKEADMILLIVDSNEGITKEDEDILKEYKDKHVIILLNKMDIAQDAKLYELEKQISHSHVIKTAAIKSQGIAEVEGLIKEILQIENGIDPNENIISQIRQRDLLTQAKDSLIQSLDSIKQGMPIDITEIDIRQGVVKLCELLGEDIDEDVVEAIFSKFCLGK